MPNIASVLKSEIVRLARKEVRDGGENLKKIASAQRAEIANLKKRVNDLEKVVKRLSKDATVSAKQPKQLQADASVESSSPGLRFRAKGMAANRKRLGLSASDFGLLVGATGQSIYAWEAGKTKPKPTSLVAIANLRGLGKRGVAAKLASLKAQQ